MPMKLHPLRAAFVLVLAALLAPLAHAQAPYPNQGIRLIVPYAPGGLPDTVARITAQHLQDRIGQSVVVENRAGGGAAAAVSALMGAPADGYTFIVTDGSIVSTNPALFKQLSYNPRDIVPLALLGSTPLFLAAHPDVPPIAEVIPGYDLATIVGLYGRPGLPQPIIDKITAEAIAAVNTPEAKKQLTAAGIEPTGGDGAAFAKALKREIDNVTAVVKS